MPRPPQSWTPDDLARDAAESRRRFVSERLAALERERTAYSAWMETYSADMGALLQASDDLRRLTGAALSTRVLLDMARYVTAPPISLDDLDTLTDASFRNWVGQRTEAGA